MKGDAEEAVLGALAMFVFTAIVLPVLMLVLKTMELTLPLTPYWEAIYQSLKAAFLLTVHVVLWALGVASGLEDLRAVLAADLPYALTLVFIGIVFGDELSLYIGILGVFVFVSSLLIGPLIET